MEPAEAIMGTVDLGDRRRSNRLRVLLNEMASQPAASLLQTFSDWAGAMAAYRFVGNPHIAVETLQAGLTAATVQRCREHPTVLLLQDTSSLDYTSHPKLRGVGPLENAKHQGLFLHTTFAVSETGLPLGVLDLQLWARDPATAGSRHVRHDVPIEGKESAKWLRGVQASAAVLGDEVQTILVADREADIYEVFGLQTLLPGEWVIRGRHDRLLEGTTASLRTTVEAAPVGATVTVELPRADGRPARPAVLAVRWATVTIQPPKQTKAVAAWWAAHPEVEAVGPTERVPLTLGVVLVTEVDAPAEVAPVEWLLLTSLPVTTAAEALRCVALYRLRWLIERYHFVLKSGCRVEQLQLETVETLRPALVLYCGVAWWLLWLTYGARVEPEAPCTVVFDEDTYQALAVALDEPVPATPPDLRTVVRQVARLGGFKGRKRDGEPGVQTLWRGMTRLVDIVDTWQRLKAHPELLTQNARSV